MDAPGAVTDFRVGFGRRGEVRRALTVAVHVQLLTPQPPPSVAIHRCNISLALMLQPMLPPQTMFRPRVIEVCARDVAMPVAIRKALSAPPESSILDPRGGPMLHTDIPARGIAQGQCFPPGRGPRPGRVQRASGGCRDTHPPSRRARARPRDAHEGEAPAPGAAGTSRRGDPRCHADARRRHQSARVPHRGRDADPRAALRRLLQDQQIAAVPHGFRSTFRDWAAEDTDHPREVIEAALAHTVHNQVAAVPHGFRSTFRDWAAEGPPARGDRTVQVAYARSDLFERRRRLMDDWAEYVGG